jgi:succinate dehydrogenase / fumarate reductase cytochrome b subunit
MAMGEGPAPVLRREWTSRRGWQGTGVGVWSWLVQRLAAVLLILAIGLHLGNPFVRPVQALLLGLVLLHGLLGLRAIVLDLGVPVRLHGALFLAAIALGILLFTGFLLWRWY